MGDAARRKAAETVWLASLDQPARSVVQAAKILGRVLPLDGACYRASLFLKLFLEQEHGIAGKAVVGFVNDGTDDLYASHAWFEFLDQLTDVTLCRPLNPELQKRGPLVIHGRVISGGWQHYTYHLKQPPEGQKIIDQLMSDPSIRGMMTEQEDIHLRMVVTADSNTLIRDYLDAAPDGLTYETIAAGVRRG